MIGKSRTDDMGKKMKRVNCMACRHFYITWDSSFPKGRRAFQFKTSNQPSRDVFHSSGQPCLKFQAN
ncbi:uracil-DNA glycosylase [Peribacillus simplex NBRC 15720 = DSM 1321]|uniref:Uracil-DNA glycosylase n=2 Tax=Peribacillus simplex TaxID=1478 RepID=A0A223EHH8_9BACI|nr:uracil-DNA glycosylase [Peribacillus simplex NBRC 15720 = DSM 1321]TVX76852.1 uracil-DNA glycosylase [Peribacillus simplex]